MTGRAGECHEEVTRAGQLEPCGSVAVALRIDPREGDPYPVCIRHVRAPMVPLGAPGRPAKPPRPQEHPDDHGLTSP